MTLQVSIKDLVEARLYGSEDEVIQDAFRHFLLTHPNLRIAVAVHRYRIDEELTLAKAAAIAGVSLERMKEILAQYGVPIRLGPESIEEARKELTTLEEWTGAGAD